MYSNNFSCEEAEGKRQPLKKFNEIFLAFKPCLGTSADQPVGRTSGNQFNLTIGQFLNSSDVGIALGCKKIKNFP